MLRRLPAEWEAQSAVQLTWPHSKTDWNYILPKIEKVFIQLVEIIIQYELVVIISPEIDYVQGLLSHIDASRIIWINAELDDTWARDHGGITILENDKPVILDFEFNGWGNKYSYTNDNLISQRIERSNVFLGNVKLRKIQFILEGGSIDTDGEGSVITTETCLLNRNRNQVTKREVENLFRQELGISRVLWLKHGKLSGDDTDSHIDTLARFVNRDTIVYSKTEDVSHPDYNELFLMEEELITFRKKDGKKYNLIPLHLPPLQLSSQGDILPANYVNFLIINGAVLIPIYNVEQDFAIEKCFKSLFSTREIIKVDCSEVIKQNGSLHCLTMNYTKGVFKN